MLPRTAQQQGSQGGVPEVVVMRLPQYIRVLNSLLDEGKEMVNSEQLGEVLQVTSAQIRKDLSYFGGSANRAAGIT